MVELRRNGFNTLQSYAATGSWKNPGKIDALLERVRVNKMWWMVDIPHRWAEKPGNGANLTAWFSKYDKPSTTVFKLLACVCHTFARTSGKLDLSRDEKAKQRRDTRVSGRCHGVTILSDGKSARKPLAFRVMRPSLACASAPIMTSATGRRAVLPDRLRWTWLFHTATAIERSSSLVPGGRSIPISKRKFFSLASSPRKAGASSTYVRGDTMRPSSRGFEQVLKPDRVRSLLSLTFSCHV